MSIQLRTESAGLKSFFARLRLRRKVQEDNQSDSSSAILLTFRENGNTVHLVLTGMNLLTIGVSSRSPATSNSVG